MRTAFATLLTCLLMTSGWAVVPAQAADTALSEPVSFSVVNHNQTLVPCASDGRTHQLRGRLVSPASPASEPTGRINVLVHDITAGGWFWHLREHPDHDYASRLADQGETSLVLDRLGYDESPLANGWRTCFGAQATMLHQVVQALRADGYDEIVLHGHSVGAAVAELEAATFQDVDGLVLMSWSDAGASFRAIAEAGKQHTACLLSRTGYAPYGKTDRDFQALLFATAPDDVRLTASSLRNPDPCGDAVSLATLVVVNNLVTRLIDVPVLLLFGGRDALTRPDGRLLQRFAYSPGAQVTAHVVPGAGSALPLEASASDTRATVLDWLDRP